MTIWDFMDKHWFIGPATVCFLAVCLVVLLIDLGGYVFRAYGVRGIVQITQGKSEEDKMFALNRIQRVLGVDTESSGEEKKSTESED